MGGNKLQLIFGLTHFVVIIFLDAIECYRCSHITAEGCERTQSLQRCPNKHDACLTFTNRFNYFFKSCGTERRLNEAFLYPVSIHSSGNFNDQIRPKNLISLSELLLCRTRIKDNS